MILGENAQVFIGPIGADPDTAIGAGDWTHIGETDGPIQWDLFPPQPEQMLFADIQWPISVTINVDATDALAAFALAYGGIDSLKHLLDNPGSHSHCRTCHPEQDLRPLAVNGQEYNRRRKARMRRKRR